MQKPSELTILIQLVFSKKVISWNTLNKFLYLGWEREEFVKNNRAIFYATAAILYLESINFF